MQLTRRNFLSSLPITAAGLAGIMGCNDGDKGKVVVVFGDISQSVRSFDPYRAAWQLVCNHIKSGDRLLLAPISGATYSEFKTLIDVESRGASWWQWLNESRSQHGADKQKLQQDVASAMEKLTSLERSDRTDILNALVLASKIFSGDTRKHILVVCSDGVQDSAELSFYKTRLTSEFTRSFIDQTKQAGRLPDLREAHVYFVGTTAATSRGRVINSEFEIESFWRNLIQACGGELLTEDYGPALLHFV